MAGGLAARAESRLLFTLAKRFARVERMKENKPNPHAAALGKLGGKARLKTLTPQQRQEIARKAGRARAEQLSAKRRKEIAAMGGKASAGSPKRKEGKK
jgi:general stress protein YciG